MTGSSKALVVGGEDGRSGGVGKLESFVDEDAVVEGSRGGRGVETGDGVDREADAVDEEVEAASASKPRAVKASRMHGLRSGTSLHSPKARGRLRLKVGKS